jgi:lysozyme
MPTVSSVLLTAAPFIKKHEGFRNKAYRCSAGKLTIGWGHNLDDNGISEGAAAYLLMEDMERSLIDLRKIFPTFDEMPENVQVALLDMHFNMGPATFRTFRVTIGLIKEGKYKEAAEQALRSKWAKQVGSRAADVVRMMKGE